MVRPENPKIGLTGHAARFPWKSHRCYQATHSRPRHDAAHDRRTRILPDDPVGHVVARLVGRTTRHGHPPDALCGSLAGGHRHQLGDPRGAGRGVPALRHPVQCRGHRHRHRAVFRAQPTLGVGSCPFTADRKLAPRLIEPGHRTLTTRAPSPPCRLKEAMKMDDHDEHSEVAGRLARGGVPTEGTPSTNAPPAEPPSSPIYRHPVRWTVAAGGTGSGAGPRGLRRGPGRRLEQLHRPCRFRCTRAWGDPGRRLRAEPWGIHPEARVGTGAPNPVVEAAPVEK